MSHLFRNHFSHNIIPVATDHPPCLKFPLGSSSGPPGACITPSRVTNDNTAIFLMFSPQIFIYMLLQFTVEELQSPLPSQICRVLLVFYWPILFDEPMFRSRVEVKRNIPSSAPNLLLRSPHPINRLPLIIRREMSQKRCSSLGKVRL